MTDATNPLLDFSGLPRFDAIKPEHVTPAIAQLIARASAVVADLEQPNHETTWENFVEPLEQATEDLGRAWGVVSHLHSVMDTPPWREAYNALLPEVTRYYSEIGQNLAANG